MKWKCMGALLLMFFVQLVGATPSANATSMYDSALRLTHRLTVKAYNEPTLDGKAMDITTTYQDILYASSDATCTSPLKQSFLDALDSGFVSVQQHISSYDGIGGRHAVNISWTSLANADPLEFAMLGSRFVLRQGGTSASATIYKDDVDDSLKTVCRQGGSGYVSSDEPDYDSSWQGLDERLFWSTYPVNYPPNYQGELVPTEPSPARYVALGDSFSSGEGVPSFEYGTDVGGTNENRCHRSPQAYPRLLQNNSSLDLGPTAFVACSGATTADVLYGGSGSGAWSEGPQVDALSSDTEIVTITIGGNDVGFSDYVYGCALAPCGPSTAFYDAILANIESPSFLDNLETAYETTLFDAPNADVYVMDYPHLVDPTGVDIPSCVLGVDMTGATGIQQALNAVIADAVDNVQGISGDYATRLHYLPTNHIGSPFIGHHLCTDDPGGAYFNGLNVWDKVYSFHPNSDGQQAYYEIMEDYLS